jgi:glycosyltransferase involved in cell wall biosynthesis
MIDAIYVALDDPKDTSSWSGSTHWAACGLESAGFQLDFIGPLRNPYYLLTGVKGRILRRLGWQYSPLGEFPVLKSFSRQVERKLQNQTGKVIISCGRPHLAFLKTKLPFVFFDDGSIPAMSRSFPPLMHLWPSNLKGLYRAEQMVLERCLYACYASDWAAEGALRHYGSAFKNKIKVIPWGANMEVKRDRAEIDSIIEKRRSDICRLLFVGVDWDRKGGPLAVAVAEELNRRGIRTELSVVGCQPSGVFPAFVRIHGFVSKKTAQGVSFLDQLYRDNHFFIMPSQGEPYGIVYVEACSYGLPVVGKDSGGPATIIRNGVNGFLLPDAAAPSAYADHLERAWRDKLTYNALCRTTFQEYESRLNWKVFGQKIHDLVSESVSRTDYL